MDNYGCRAIAEPQEQRIMTLQEVAVKAIINQIKLVHWLSTWKALVRKLKPLPLPRPLREVIVVLGKNMGLDWMDRRHRCQSCGKLYTNLGQCHMHEQRQHGIVHFPVRSCQLCGKGFMKEGDYVVHLEKQHPRYSCKWCPGMRYHKPAFLTHLRKVHGLWET